MPFKESNLYLRTNQLYQHNQPRKTGEPELAFTEFVLKSTPQGCPELILKAMDQYCQKQWMMHVGNQKGAALTDAIKKREPKTILELGTYCGYSSLMMAQASKAVIHTFDVNPTWISYASKIHEHSGVSDRIHIHQGSIQNNCSFFSSHEPFDLIFIDHWKDLYLSDLKWLQENKVIKNGTVIVADNIIFPGAPDYLSHMKDSKAYDSTLYHSYNSYTDNPDAIMVSLRIGE